MVTRRKAKSGGIGSGSSPTVSCLLLAFVVLDIHYQTIEAKDNRPSSLRVAICHREKFALSNRLFTADVYKNAQSLLKLLHGSFVTSHCALSPRQSAGRSSVPNEEDSTQLFGPFDAFVKALSVSRRVVALSLC